MSAHKFCDNICASKWRVANRSLGYAILWDNFVSWSANLAYFVGLMLADGNVMDKGAISFVGKDRCLVEFVQGFIAPDSPIRVEHIKTGGIAYRWSIWSTELRDRFAGLGIHPRKSKTMDMPDIPAQFIWDFIRGVLDGDGSVDKARRASFSTGSESFANSLHSLFVANGFRSTLYTNAGCFVVFLNVSSSKALSGLMYWDGCPHLSRKRLRFLRV
jgi:hypothetical protein